MKSLHSIPQSGDIFMPTGIYARGHRMRRTGMARISLDEAPHEMIFEKCRSIHTFGMKFALRVIFLDADSRVISTRIVHPRRIVVAPRGTHAIVEQPLR